MSLVGFSNRQDETVGMQIDRELQKECRAESIPGSGVYEDDDGISCLFDKRTESDAFE